MYGGKSEEVLFQVWIDEETVSKDNLFQHPIVGIWTRSTRCRELHPKYPQRTVRVSLRVSVRVR